jgi:hypothetical protein
MGQAKLKASSKRIRFIRLLEKITKQYDKRQIMRFADIRGLR